MHVRYGHLARIEVLKQWSARGGWDYHLCLVEVPLADRLCRCAEALFSCKPSFAADYVNNDEANFYTVWNTRMIARAAKVLPAAEKRFASGSLCWSMDAPWNECAVYQNFRFWATTLICSAGLANSKVKYRRPTQQCFISSSIKIVILAGDEVKNSYQLLEHITRFCLKEIYMTCAYWQCLDICPECMRPEESQGHDLQYLFSKTWHTSRHKQHNFAGWEMGTKSRHKKQKLPDHRYGWMRAHLFNLAKAYPLPLIHQKVFMSKD